MNNTTELQVLFGVLSVSVLPVIVSFLKRCEWKDWIKSLLSFVVAIALGMATVYISGAFNLKNVTGTVTAIYTASHLLYTVWFKRLDFNKWLESKEPI